VVTTDEYVLDDIAEKIEALEERVRELEEKNDEQDNDDPWKGFGDLVRIIVIVAGIVWVIRRALLLW
jgi:hypothetical protein